MGKLVHVPILHRSLAALLVVTTTAISVADEAEGVVRISSDPETEVVIRGQSSDITLVSRKSKARKAAKQGEEYSAECPPEVVYDCPPEYVGGPHCGKGNCFSNCFRRQCMIRRCRTQATSNALADCFHEECAEKCRWMHCKFGYFIPSGCNGKGCPPVGHYSMVYPLDPNYFDARDGQVYAAPGYAGPVAVPLAPVVHHTYNYGWGIPSSRLTPISHPIPR